MERFLLWGQRLLGSASESLMSLIMLGLRVYLASILLIVHAWPKAVELWTGHGHFPALVAKMGLPAPMLFAWMATLAQIGGSLMLAVGLFTRLGSFFVLSTLLVGIPSVHWGDPFRMVEAGVMYMILLAAFIGMGAGRYSLDAMLLGRLEKRSS